MATTIKVRPAVPLAGGAAGLAFATLHHKSAKQTLLYAALGAGLAWAGAAALIVRTAVQETITPSQASQLAGSIADRETQRQSLSASSGADTDLLGRLDREIQYLTNVLDRNQYQYQNGKAIKLPTT